MLAQCPQCSTVFRLPLSLLEAAQGRVRCGHCDAVFDAAGDLPSDLQKLLSQRSPADTEAGPDVLLSSAQEDEAVPEFQLSEEELDAVEVFVEAAPAFDAEAPAFEPDEVTADGTTVDEFTDSTADTAENTALSLEVGAAQVQEDITLEGQKVSIFNEETGEYRTFAADTSADMPQEHFDQQGENTVGTDAQRLTEQDDFHEPATEPEPPAADLAMLVDSLAGSTAAASENRRRWPWLAGSLLLTLMLALQLAHFNRDRLALVPGIGPWLITFYHRLGLPLSPAWDVAAYRVRQWGAAAEKGALRIRASVFNTARRPQPYPLLRLTLQDRFGEPLGMRDLQPRDYLPSISKRDGAGAPEKLLAPGQRIDADIALVDPGKNAIGFELDACLRDEHTFVRCANDLRRKVK